MASFSAELRVAGRVYPLLRCEYSTGQGIDSRGRVNTRVRHNPISLLLDVPRDNFLAAWGADAYKRCAVDIVYHDDNGGRALETLHMAGAQCTGYGQRFQEGYLPAGSEVPTEGSYLAYLTLTDPDGFTWKVGGPGAYAAPAAGQHGLPPAVPLVAPNPAATAAQELAAKQQRYNKRLGLLGRARTQLAGPAGARLPADQRQRVQAATERLARNNVAVERARLSEHVYHSDLPPPLPAPTGWHMLSEKELARKGITKAMLNDPASGFKAALYESSFERPPKTVIAYAGTENAADWGTNFKQGVGVETKQYNSAMKLAKAVVKTNDVSKIDITGHSLGGGLASAGAAVTGAKGYTFNAAGLHLATVGRAPYSISTKVMAERGGLIDAYHSTADPLTNLQSGLDGSLSGLAGQAFGWPVGPKALGIPRPLVPAAGWQHEWGELVKRNPATSATNMALEGHGVDPEMVDNIEVQKGQDTATLTHFTGSAP